MLQGHAGGCGWTAQQVWSYKPSLCPFQVLERIGVPLARLLHVVQSLFHDHVPAKQLGLTTVWVNRRHDKPGQGRPRLPRLCPTWRCPICASW